MKSYLATCGVWILLTVHAAADIVTWGAIDRSVVAEGSFEVIDEDRCDVEYDEEMWRLICLQDETRIEKTSRNLDPLAGEVDFGDYGRHAASQAITIKGDTLRWTSDALTLSTSGGPGSHWFSAGGQGVSRLVAVGELARPAVVHLTANLWIEGDSYDDDGPAIRLRHVDAKFNERVLEWRVSCNGICASMPPPLSVDEIYLLPSGQLYLEAEVFASGGYNWDNPRVHADFELSFAPVPEPAAWMLIAAIGCVMPTTAAWRRRRLTNS